MKKFECLLGFVLGHLTLSHTDSLSRTQQHSVMAAGERPTSAKGTLQILRSLRADRELDMFSHNVTVIKERQRKVPKRYDVATNGKEILTTEQKYRCIYLEAVTPYNRK